MNPLHLLFLLLSLAYVSLSHIPTNSAVGTFWTFPNSTWIENLAVRSNGQLICTSLNRASIYLVNPFAHTATTVHHFVPETGVLGIAEIENDVFVVATADVDLETSAAKPGTARLWRVDMAGWELKGESGSVTLVANLTSIRLPDGIVSLPSTPSLVLIADAAQGVIHLVETTTGRQTTAMRSSLFLPPSAGIPLGVDGLKIHKNWLYFTNLGVGILGRMPVSPRGIPTGPVEIVANLTAPDDFALGPDGTAYVVGANTLYRVRAGGKVDVLAGGVNGTVLEGATSAQLGRTREDWDVLYIGTNGGLLAPVDGIIHGGQVAAINIGLFD